MPIIAHTCAAMLPYAIQLSYTEIEKPKMSSKIPNGSDPPAPQNLRDKNIVKSKS